MSQLEDDLQTHETRALGCVLLVGALCFIAGVVAGMAAAT